MKEKIPSATLLPPRGDGTIAMDRTPEENILEILVSKVFLE
jgi:hypothetical protein